MSSTAPLIGYKVKNEVVNGTLAGQPNIVVRAGEILKEKLTSVFFANKQQEGIQVNRGENKKVFIPSANLEPVYAETVLASTSSPNSTETGLSIATKVLLAVGALVVLFLIFKK